MIYHNVKLFFHTENLTKLYNKIPLIHFHRILVSVFADSLFPFRFYSKESLVGDPDFGPILSSLLVGPCALEYTKVRSNSQFWYELPANELVQR